METSFLQSNEWQEFQASLGRESFRWQNLLFIRMRLPLGKTFLYCPRAEIGQKQFKSAQQFLNDLAPQIRDTDIFIRVEPVDNFKIQDVFSAPATQPKITTILDLSHSEEQILSKMKQKTRYNLNLAKKNLIQVSIENNINERDFHRFWLLMDQTSQRNNFNLHPKEYYLKMLTVLGENKLSYFIEAELKDDLLSAMILIIYEKQAIYLHGCSNSKLRQLMAPYLMHWEAIKFAQSRGCKIYDFWGIKMPKNQNRENVKELEGVTRFKLGFGGEIIYYPDSFEIPIKKLEYYGYRTVRKIDRIINPRTF